MYSFNLRPIKSSFVKLLIQQKINITMIKFQLELGLKEKVANLVYIEKLLYVTHSLEMSPF